MTDEQLRILKEEVRIAVRETVNGKIDRVRDKLDEHIRQHEIDMEEIKPFMRGAAGLGLLWKGLIVVGGLAVAYTQIKSIFTK